MKRLLIFGVLLLLCSGTGCIEQKSTPHDDTISVGDTIKVDYIGRLEDGSVFDTSLEDVAKHAGIYNPQRIYNPLQFKVGAGEMIAGFDNGVVGMKVTETKNITVPPEMGYGPIDEKKIQRLDIDQQVPLMDTLPKTFAVPADQFTSQFGNDHKIGDVVDIPGMELTATVVELGDAIVNLSLNLKKGDTFNIPESPWMDEVTAVDDVNITIKHIVTPGEIVRLGNVPWNTTIINITDKNMTLHHNRIPDTTINTMFGPIQVSFSDDKLIMDRNPPLAGKTLIFTVTVEEIVSKAGSVDGNGGAGLPPVSSILPLPPEIE
ncbi:hypothetical protein DRN76_03390 [Methanosarcinales archaeon]|nr:MAG: hypothetical protein DRN76_03390 [Methanosarcinales archaeon]